VLHSRHLKAAATLLIAVGFVFQLRAEAGREMDQGFLHPPLSARPRTLWMWMNGNVTSNGITLDLEAMQRAGLGGALIFNAGEFIPKGPVDYGSRGWLDLMTHAVSEAQRLGLELAMHNGPGWSSSGGPWITPETSMQQLVWSETRVTGQKNTTLNLPQPFTRLNYYRDVCVLAFPSLPGDERPFPELLASVTKGRGASVDKNLLTDGNLATGVAAGPQEPLVFEFAEPFEARAVTVWPSSGGAAVAFTLEASDDATNFHNVVRLTPPGPRSIGDSPLTESFDPVKARFFRLTPVRSRDVLEFELHSAARIAGWHYKANFAHRAARNEAPPAAVAKQFVVDPASVRDLTAQMDAQGRLTWNMPPGAWTILRLGHTARGQQNIAAPEAGVGLECDKLSAAGVEFHFQHGLQPLLEALGPLAGKSFTGLEVDSYEVGMQNWTKTFPDEFQKENGYDLRRYLPAMTGRVVGSAEASERFLWDVRRTQADLVANQYYGRLHDLCRQHNLQLYVEPYGAGPGPYDELQTGGRADVPMGEFWSRFPWDDTASVKLAASAAHTYGRSIVAGESFTADPVQSRWLEYPYALKPVGDLAFSLGLNQMFFHRFAHQPHPTAVPGMTMGPWGIHFDRTATWFAQSGVWLDYLARCQFLLRQGKFVADVLYFTGEGSPQMSKLLQPELPAGYNFDAADAEVLLGRARIQNGRIVLPDGANYRLLALPNDLRGMTPLLLRRLSALVGQGMILAGPRPAFSPSLRGYPAGDAEVRRLVAQIWDGAGDHVFGARPLAEVLRQLDLKPDFEYSGAQADAALVWSHRRTGEADIYFVANRQRRSEDVIGTFRVDGRRPEFWRPETGEIENAAIYDSAEGRVRVPMHLDPAESVFVVFRAPAEEKPPQWVTRDRNRIIDSAPVRSYTTPSAAVTNGFTVALWVRPDTDLRTMPRESVDGRVDDGGKSYVIPAPEGGVSFGADHAVMGLAVGRNGVFVFERSADRAPAVLVSGTPISGWTHLAVVYRDGQPSLYLNGKLAREGLKSGKIVHCGLGLAPPARRIVYYFEGEMTPPKFVAEPLGEGNIATLAADGLPGPENPFPIEVTRRGVGNLEALIWDAGRYTLDDGRTVEARDVPAPVTLSGPWQVDFPPDRGAPTNITLTNLISLRLHPDPGVRYFSGTATYTRAFTVATNSLARDRRLFLDLGRVEVSAAVSVNGRNLGILWKPPYRVDVTEAVHAGTNQLELQVADLWPNRLIGDEQLPPENHYDPRTHAIDRLPDWYLKGEAKPAGGRTTFTTWQFYNKDDPLLEAGLLGPVRLFNPVRRTFSR
jgi:hypothetical protein